MVPAGVLEACVSLRQPRQGAPTAVAGPPLRLDAEVGGAGEVSEVVEPTPATTYPFSVVRRLFAVRAARAAAGLERGGDRSAGPAGVRAARAALARRLEPVEKVVTQWRLVWCRAILWVVGHVNCSAHAGRRWASRWASGRKVR